MIDTKKPVRFYNKSITELNRVYYYMGTIQSENDHVCTCNIQGEPENFILINKSNHTILNPVYKNWCVENYEISNYPYPELKFVNSVEALEVDMSVLAEWQTNKITSQIEAWSIINSPYRKIESDEPESIVQAFKNLFKSKDPNKPILKKLPQRTFDFLLKEYYVKHVLVRDCFMGVKQRPSIGKYTNSINVVNSIEVQDIAMPVYHAKLNTGAEIMMYNDLYKYCVSIISPEPINIDLDIFYEPSTRLFPNDCLGFKPEWIFAPYTENKKQFTVCLENSDYDFFTFLYLLYLDIKTKQK